MPKIIKLDIPVWDGLKRVEAKIKDLQLELMLHQDAMARLLAQATGLDFESENWSLDLEHGLLELNEENDG